MRNTRGWAHIDLLNYQKAIEDLNKAIELDPKYAYAYCNRSRAYFMLKNYHQALEDANKAIESTLSFQLLILEEGGPSHHRINFKTLLKILTKRLNSIRLSPCLFYSGGIHF